MKLQFVFNRYLPIVGGAELQGAQLVQKMRQHGHDVHVVTRRILPDLAAEEVIDEVTVRRLAPVGLSKRANALIVFRLIAYLLTHARRADVIHSHIVGPIGLASIIAGNILRKPVVIRVATYGELIRQDARGLKGSPYKVLIRRILLPPFLWNWILRRAAAMVALSSEIVAEGQQVGLGDKIVHIPNGVDTSRFYPIEAAQRTALRHSLQLDPDDFIIFCSARLVFRKRIDVLIDALPIIRQQVPRAMLLIAGGTVLDEDSVVDLLQAQVKRLGLQDAVQFLGAINTVTDYLQVSDVFAFPSEREGMPNAVLEAMATQLPIVASQIGGVVDLLDDDTGWMLPVGDVTGFADAIITIATDPQLATIKAKNAHQRVQDHFTIERTAEKYEALYTKVMNRQVDSATETL